MLLGLFGMPGGMELLMIGVVCIGVPVFIVAVVLGVLFISRK